MLERRDGHEEEDEYSKQKYSNFISTNALKIFDEKSIFLSCNNTYFHYVPSFNEKVSCINHKPNNTSSSPNNSSNRILRDSFSRNDNRIKEDTSISIIYSNKHSILRIINHNTQNCSNKLSKFPIRSKNINNIKQY